MHLASPRIGPLADADMSPDQEAAVAPLRHEPVGVLNIFRTLAHAPDALKAFLTWGNYILSKRNTLPPREREIVVLRIGYLCRSGYEWTQHVEIGKRVGLTADEIARIKTGEGLSDADGALIRACDELHARQFVSDSVWAVKSHFSEKQCMDIVFTAGQYTQVSMMLNTFGVQLDSGQTLDLDLRA